MYGYYDECVAPRLLRNVDSKTRGISLKLLRVRSRIDLKKFSFCNRVVGLWNSLPDSVVLSQSINAFKNNLDKLWIKEDIYYNWEANMSNMLAYVYRCLLI